VRLYSCQRHHHRVVRGDECLHFAVLFVKLGFQSLVLVLGVYKSRLKCLHPRLCAPYPNHQGGHDDEQQVLDCFGDDYGKRDGFHSANNLGNPRVILVVVAEFVKRPFVKAVSADTLANAVDETMHV